jgi:GNAT superfamily N-acetyltransferase
MYADYVLEREGKRVLETDHGFATFSVKQDYIYIEDIYVIPEKRKKGAASFFVDSIVAEYKTENITKLIGSVDLSSNGARESMLAILQYGFKPLSYESELLYFIKEI